MFIQHPDKTIIGQWNDLECYNSFAVDLIPKNYICKRAVVAVFFVYDQSVGALHLVYEQVEHIRLSCEQRHYR
jgi:hypothetical protein